MALVESRRISLLMMGCSWFVGDNAAYLGRGCKRRDFAPDPTKGDGPWNRYIVV